MEKTIVCIASYFKGDDFLRQCKALGNRVILVTSQSLKKGNWPWESIDETYYMPEIKPSVWDLEDFTKGFAYLMKKYEIDAVIGLDDYDIEKAAHIREFFRIPGMGLTTYHYFKDKLAMRQQALDTGIAVPEFTSVFNDDKVRRFIEEVPAPWVLKPRGEASAMGIKKIQSEEELWAALESLGDDRMNFLLESFKPGTVYHVDSLVYNGRIMFTAYGKYLTPPMTVSHDGGVFRTVTLGRRSNDATDLNRINRQVIANFGLKYGATHTEFIKGEDGEFYFLETSSRIAGAHIPDMIEASTGVNMWREWANIENAVLDGAPYTLEETEKKYAGLLVSLCKDEKPDLKPFESEETVKFFDKKYHIIAVYSSDKAKTILERLDEAADYVTNELLSVMPAKDKPAGG